MLILFTGARTPYLARVTCPMADRLTVNIKSYRPQGSNSVHHRRVFTFYLLKACLAEQSAGSRVIDRELQVHGEAEGSNGLWSEWGQRPTIQLGPPSSCTPK